MKIQGFQNIPAVLQNLKSEPKVSTETPTAPGQSSVSLSSFAETLQALQRANAQTTQDRQTRVEELAQKEKAGTYQPDLSVLADRLVQLNIVDLGQ